MLSESLTTALGWTLLHSLWQGLFVFLISTAAIKLWGKSSSLVRYRIWAVSLCCLVVLICFTAFDHLYADTVSISFTDVNDLKDESFSLGPDVRLWMANNQHAWRNLQGSLTSFFSASFWLIEIGWLFGSVFYCTRFFKQVQIVKSLSKAPSQNSTQEVRSLLDMLRRKLNISRAVELKLSSTAPVPITVGFLRPQVILPETLVNDLEPERLESILAHELSHIRRDDYLFNIIQAIVETLLFFNPIVWLIGAHLRDERELRADELAIAATQSPRVFYAETLLSVAELQKSRAVSLSLAFSGVQRKKSLLARIKRLVLPTLPGPTQTQKLMWGSLVVTIAFLLFSGIQAQMDLRDGMRSYVLRIEDSSSLESLEIR